MDAIREIEPQRSDFIEYFLFAYLTYVWSMLKEKGAGKSLYCYQKLTKTQLLHS